jgi:hypothetical protein
LCVAPVSVLSYKKVGEDRKKIFLPATCNRASRENTFMRKMENLLFQNHSLKSDRPFECKHVNPAAQQGRQIRVSHHYRHAGLLISQKCEALALSVLLMGMNIQK